MNLIRRLSIRIIDRMNSQSTINTLFIIGFYIFKIKFVLLKLAKMHNIKQSSRVSVFIHTQTGRFTGLRTH